MDGRNGGCVLNSDRLPPQCELYIKEIIKEEVEPLKEDFYKLKREKQETSDARKDFEKLDRRIDEVLEKISEKAWQEGENAATLQDVSDRVIELGRVMEESFKEQNRKIEENKPLPIMESIASYIMARRYRKVFAIIFIILSVGSMLGSFAFYAGNQATLFDIVNILKEFLK